MIIAQISATIHFIQPLMSIHRNFNVVNILQPMFWSEADQSMSISSGKSVVSMLVSNETDFQALTPASMLSLMLTLCRNSAVETNVVLWNANASVHSGAVSEQILLSTHCECTVPRLRVSPPGGPRSGSPSWCYWSYTWVWHPGSSQTPSTSTENKHKQRAIKSLTTTNWIKNRKLHFYCFRH